MIGIPLANLKVGDIIVDRAPDQSCHSLVVVQTGNDPRVVHVDARIVEEDLSAAQGQGGELFAFRMKHHQYGDVDAVRTLVGQFAQAWAVTQTPYGSFPSNVQVQGANRFQGTKAARQSTIIPPLEYDALFRVLKWAKKAEEGLPFSEHRGTTCCAFLLATYQAACVTDYVRTTSGRMANVIPAIFASVRDHRAQPVRQGQGVQLTDPRSGWQHTFYQDQALIQHSNRGISTQQKSQVIAQVFTQYGIEPIWKRAAGLAFGWQKDAWSNVTRISRILTPALDCDVKYSAATLLINRLSGNGWKAL
ncbi:MAG: hypothetical protein KC549_01980 [Myxococcales bacterium]|nr:hypothetical protein [Myxococcales bacterium]MCB9547994.1 hypothetical protein [Myxococcales bacterium]